MMNRYEEVRGLGAPERSDYVRRLVEDNTQEDVLITDMHREKMIGNIEQFLSDSVMADLLERQKSIHTDIPFIMKQKAIGYSEFEDQMLQRIMDALLEIDGSYVILDYKTDRVAVTGLGPTDLVGRYRTKMDIYRRSAMQALGKDVTV